MEETLKAKIGCKKIKPRRKFKCEKSSIYYGAKVRFSPDREWGRVKAMKVVNSSWDNPTMTARELAATYRFVCPRASIYVRRGHKVTVKPHNELDCLILLKFMAEYERSQGREMNAEIMLANRQILPIDAIDVFENPKKKKDGED